MRLFINGHEVTDWVGWEKAELQISRDVENLQLTIDFNDVKVLGQGVQLVQQQFSLSTPMRVEVEFVSGVRLEGKVYAHGVKWGRDYVLLSAELDNISEFQRRIEGRLVPEALIAEVRYVVAPRVDRAVIVGLLVATFMLTYLLIKELFELKRDLATLTGIAGAGVGGPVSSAVSAALILAARLVYLALLVVAIVNLVKELLNLIDRIEKTKAFNLHAALEYFAAQAGYNTLDAPAWLNRVWIVGETLSEALELFNVAKRLTNSIIFVDGNAIRFISSRSGSFPAGLRRGWEERWRYASDEIARRELISLIRDTSDEHTLSVPAAVEIDRRGGLRGYKRHDIPFAPAAVAGDRAVFRYARALLNALALFSRRIRNVQAQLQQAQNLIVAEREHFVAKIVYAENAENVSADNAKTLLEHIADAYRSAQLYKVYDEVKVPFSIHDYNILKNTKFAGLRRLTWRVAEEWALVEYEEATTQSLQANTTII